METLEILFLLTTLSFIGLFLYKLYKVLTFAEDYTIPKIIISTIAGFFLYGLSLFIIISEVTRLTTGYFTLFRFVSLFFVLFFIFTFIDLFMFMKNWAKIKQGGRMGLKTSIYEKYS